MVFLAGPIGIVAGGYLNADGGIKPEVQSVIDDYMSVDANFTSVAPAQCIRIKKIDIFFFEEGGFDKAHGWHMVNYWARIMKRWLLNG